MIKFATDNDKNRIIDLWIRAFGDSVENVELFLKYFPCQRALAYYVNDEIASFMFLPELAICHNGSYYRANYIYALCTAEELRSKGYASKLIAFSRKYSAENNISYTLIRPSTDSLFDYYLAKGFEREYRREKKNLTIDTDLLYNSTNKGVSDIAYAQWGSDGKGYSYECKISDDYSPCVGTCQGERYLMIRRNLDNAELFENAYMGFTFE